MKDVIKFQDKYYILATSSIVEEQNRVLKDDETFGIFNMSGNIRPFGFENQGIFFQGTRFLSRMVFNIEGMHPVLLSSTIKQDNEYFIINMTNPDFVDHNNEMVEKDILHVRTIIYLKDGLCCRKDHITNFGSKSFMFDISYSFDADFVDIFELRGIKREKRGKEREPLYGKNSILFSYAGLDNITRETCIYFSVAPRSLKDKTAQFELLVLPAKTTNLNVNMGLKVEKRLKQKKISCTPAVDIEKKNDITKIGETVIETSSKTFNKWLQRSGYDLFMMLSRTSEGYYPFAGIPWFSTFFGRDGIITALMSLWLFPDIARGVLAYLASTQAKTTDAKKESEPGKIIHEQRKGEMAYLEEIPFGDYYGAVDSTPLFIILCGYYLKRTGDIKLIKRLWPSIKNALNWLEESGDIDGDGFVEYERKNPDGLSQQGWRDSWNAIYHRNEEQPGYPIALSEVQGYVYEAKLQASHISDLLNEKDIANKLRMEAKKLRNKFEDSFWDEDLGLYSMALDGEKKPCKIRCSSAGHSLFSGIATQEKAQILAERILNKKFYSGWGIRTIAEGEPGYNPMSYHNGTIWPHDNAMIAYGMSRYGYKQSTVRITNSLFEASQYMEKNRLPELFCGFKKDYNTGPILYPLSCSPQSWAAASVFMLIQACIGLHINAPENRIYLDKPRLPHYLNTLRIRNLKVNDSNITINLHKKGRGVGVFSSSTDNIKVIITK